MDSATFSYSRFSASMQLGLTPIFMILLLALMWGGVHIALSDSEDAWVGVCAVAGGLWGLVLMWQWIRYRHALRERYTLDEHGVVVESQGTTLKLRWSDFERAEYLIIPGMLRLESKALNKPVFLFLDGQGTRINERNRFAEQLVASQMRERFRKTWTL
jgi:hypothetical protein